MKATFTRDELIDTVAIVAVGLFILGVLMGMFWLSLLDWVGNL